MARFASVPSPASLCIGCRIFSMVSASSTLPYRLRLSKETTRKSASGFWMGLWIVASQLRRKSAEFTTFFSLRIVSLQFIRPVTRSTAAAKFTRRICPNIRFILVDEGDDAMIRMFFEQQGIDLNIQYRVVDDYAVVSMVEGNLGISVCPELFFNRRPSALTINLWKRTFAANSASLTRRTTSNPRLLSALWTMSSSGPPAARCSATRSMSAEQRHFDVIRQLNRTKSSHEF